MKSNACLSLLPFVTHIPKNNLARRWPSISFLAWSDSCSSRAETFWRSRKSRLFLSKSDFYDCYRPCRVTSRVLGSTSKPKVCGSLPWGWVLYSYMLTCSRIHVCTRVYRPTHQINPSTFINTLIQAPSNAQSPIHTHKFACTRTICCAHFNTLFEIDIHIHMCVRVYVYVVHVYISRLVQEKFLKVLMNVY